MSSHIEHQVNIEITDEEVARQIELLKQRYPEIHTTPGELRTVLGLVLETRLGGGMTLMPGESLRIDHQGPVHGIPWGIRVKKGAPVPRPMPEPLAMQDGNIKAAKGEIVMVMGEYLVGDPLAGGFTIEKGVGQ